MRVPEKVPPHISSRTFQRASKRSDLRDALAVVFIDSVHGGIGLCASSASGILLPRNRSTGEWGAAVGIKLKGFGYGGFGMASSRQVYFVKTEEELRAWLGGRGATKLRGELGMGLFRAGGEMHIKGLDFDGIGSQKNGAYLSAGGLVKWSRLDSKVNTHLHGHSITAEEAINGSLGIPESTKPLIQELIQLEASKTNERVRNGSAIELATASERSLVLETNSTASIGCVEPLAAAA